MRRIKKIKDKVRSKLGGGSDSDRPSTGSTPRTSADSAKVETRIGKPTGRRGLLREDPGTSIPQTSVPLVAVSSSHLPTLTSSPAATGRVREEHRSDAGVSTMPFSADLTDPGPSPQPRTTPSPLPAREASTNVESEGGIAGSSTARTDHAGPSAAPTRATSDMEKTVLGGLSALLKVAKEASAPLPPLQTALGAVLACVEIYTVSARYS